MTPTLELIETKTLKHHKNPRVTLQGYLYVLQKRCRLYCRWKCNRLLTFRCPCVLKTSLDLNNMQVMGMDHEHNHPDDLEAIHNLKFKLVFNDKVGNQKTWFKSMYPIKERENFKRFVPEEIKNNTIAPIQFIKTKEDFNVSSIYESPENINRDRNYIDSQMNKFKQIYSRKEIHNIDHHHNTNKYNEKIEESTVTDNRTNFSNLGSANNTYSSILRSILTSSKNNRVGIPYYVFPPNENYYARILKINLQKNNITNLSINNKDLFSNTQIETIILETSNQINTNIKHNTSDINFINNNCKRIYVEDDDNFINNNSKKICLSKIHCINSQVEITDISIHDDGKNIHVHKNQDIYTQVEYTDISINDDKIFHNNNDTNNIYIYKTNTTIDDDRKINDGIDKDKNTKVEDTSISINDDKIVHNNNGINNTYINETNTSIDDDKKMNDGIDKVKNTKVEDTSISINYDKIVHNNNGINNTYINETNISIDDDKKMNDGIDKDKNTKVEDTGISINDDKIVHNNNDTNNTYINETNTSIDNKKIKNGIDKDKNTKVEDTGISINDDKIVLNNNDTNNTYINETNTSINDGIDKYKNTKVEDTGISINDDKIVHNNNDTNNIYINKTNISIDDDKKIKNGIDKDKNTKLEDTGIYINDDKIVYNNNGINNTYINETNTFIDNKKINDGIDKDKNTKVEDTGISINDDKIVQNNNDTNNTYINETNTSIDDGKKINDGIDKDKNTKVEDTGISINDDKIVHNNNDTNNTYINETNTSIDDDKKIKNGIDKDKNTKVEDTGISINDDKIVLNNNDTNNTYINETNTSINDGIDKYKNTKVEDTGISINDDKIVLNNNDTNNTYINETNTSINDGIDKYKNTKVEDTDISIDVEKKVHVDDEENSTKEVGNIISTLKNDLNSKNMDNIIKNLNNSKTGKKVFNSLVQMKFISLLVHSTSFRKKLTKFKTNKFLWKRKFDKLILDMNQMGNICKRIVNMKNYSPKCEKLQLRNVGVQVDIKEEMKEELSRPFFNQDNNSKLVPNVIHIDLTDSGNEPLDYQKANITQSNTSGLINSGIICLDIPSSQIITDVTKNIKSNVLNSNIIPKSKTLPDVSLTVPNQNVSEEKIENNYTLSTKIPLKKSKSIPNAAVLRMKPKKELKKISFATEISFKNVQNLSNTKKLNSKFSYTFTANEKLKNISNILTPNKTSLPDVVQSTQILKNVCHSHEMCTCNSNDQKDLSFSPKSVHFTILCQELIRFRSTETQGPFLENLNDVEKRLHPPMLETTVSKLYDYNPPSAVLTWEFGSNFRCSQIIKNVKSYEVAMISILNNNNELTCDGWEQIGLVKALQLPMACTVQLDKDCRRTYYFAVRAQDTKQRWGPFNVSSGLIF